MTKARFAVACLLFPAFCLAQPPAAARYQHPSAYPEPESSAVWRSLGASYVRKALKDNSVDRDPVLNSRIDAVMLAVGKAAGGLYPKFERSSWTALLIENFGHGAVAFPGGTVLVDARFVRNLDLTDDELALVLAHEVAHVVADHPSEKLSFMAETIGRELAPNAGSALHAFFAQDSYALLFQPTARLQEREADAIGGAIFHATAYDPQRALALFDKLEQIERAGNGSGSATHDPAAMRKRAVDEAISRTDASGERPKTDRR
jgi:predicted Zn-dependent protease